MTAVTAPTTTTPTTTSGKARRRRLRAAAAGVAAVATSAVALVASALGADFRLTDSGGTVVLGLPTIIAFTLVFAALGWASLALLERFTRRRPAAARTAWTALAAAVTALSLAPIYLEHATTGTKISLTVIHLTVAAVLIPAFRRSTR